MIIVQSPLRVSLFGGGTDFPSYYLQKGGCVLSTAIDKSIFVTVKRRFDDKLRIGYTRTEMVDSLEEIQHELIREALRKTGISRGVEITTMGDIPSAGTGLGSSSAVTIGVLHALYTFLGEKVPAERLAREACEIEINTLGKPIGVQDQFIVAYGGLRFIEFTPEGEVLVESIVLEPELRRRLDENLLLFYTDITRKSDTILTEQKANIADRLSLLKQMKRLAYSARKEIENGNLDIIGHMLHYSWKLKRQLASKITNPTIDEIYSSARRAGALGGKITGAGGGGFLLLYCPQGKQDAIRNALSQLQELPFHIDQDGAKVIFNYLHSSSKLSTNVVNNRFEERIQMPKFQPTSMTISPHTNASLEDKNALIQYTQEVKQTLDKLPFPEIARVIEIMHNARQDQRPVFIFGNGGSASTATHFVCDLSKNTRMEGMPDFRVMGLSDNMAVVSAYANDEGYENVFVGQLANLINAGDIVIAISASGNSMNVIRAIEFANESEATTIGLTGFDGGELGKIVDVNLHIPSDCIEQVEDMHLMLEHMITQSLRKAASPISLFERREDIVDEISRGREDSEEDRFEEAICFQKSSESVCDRGTIEWLFEVNRKLANQIDLLQALETILRSTVERVNATSGSILIFNSQCKNIGGFVVYQDGVRSRRSEQLTDILERGLAGWVVENQTAALVPNTNNDSRWLKREWENNHEVVRSAICTPLHIHGNLIGVLTVVSSNGNQYTKEDLAQISAVAICVSILGANFNIFSIRGIETELYNA